MSVAVFSTKHFDKTFLEKSNSSYKHKLVFFEERLTEQNTALAIGFRAVCVFVNDQLNSKVLTELSVNGTNLIALRCAGFNNVDIVTAGELGLTVVRVPEYSPYAVAEHTVALITTLNRRVCRAQSISRMKTGVMLINTSRGVLIDTKAVIEALKSGRIGYLGLDVYEEEADMFFKNLSNQIIQDDVLARLLTFPNVIITGHQAFFTRNALENIAKTTLANIADFEKDQSCANKINAEIMVR